MVDKHAVSPELASMAAADAAKVVTVTTAQRIADLNKLIGEAFAKDNWQELSKLSGQMVTLKNTQAREVAAKLEAKLVEELAEVLEAYEVELADYNECRIHILHEEDGMKFKLTLMDLVAPAVRKVTSSSTAALKTIDKNGYETDSHGLPTSESLLVKFGDTVVSEKDNRTFKVAMAEAKGKKNELFQLRKKLLKVAGY